MSLATWWWEAIDPATRQSSLNHVQAEIDPDGVFRAVISHEDPGVSNWLDCAGHERGTCIARFVMAEKSPIPSYRVLKLGDLDQHIPADSPRIDPAAREARLARRRRAVWSRFRR